MSIKQWFTFKNPKLVIYCPPFVFMNAKMKICCKFFIGGNFHDVRIICMLGHIDIKIEHKYLKLNSPLQKRKGIFKSFTQRMDIIIVISANGGMLVM